MDGLLTILAHPETLTGTEALMLAFGTMIVIIALAYFAAKLTVFIKAFAVIRKNKANYKLNMKIVEEMKANGDHHEWETIPVLGQEVHVCRKTMYCPTLDGFVQREYFNETMAQKEDQKNYAVFRDGRLGEICTKYGITVDNLNLMINEISGIPMGYVESKIKKEGKYTLKVGKDDKPLQ